MTTTTAAYRWVIRPIRTIDGRMFLAVAIDDATGRETIAKDRYNESFRTEAAARQWIKATFHNGTSFPPIRTGSAAETSDRIRFGALYC